MDLIRCPRCGEDFSPSYRKCPFCEEGDHPRRVKYNGGKSGRRGKKQTYSARGAMAGVLVVVLVLMGWALFGDNIVAHLSGARTPGTEQSGDKTPTGGDAQANADSGDAIDPDGAEDPNGEASDPEGGTPPDVSGEGNAADPSGGTTDTSGSVSTDTPAPTVDPASLSVRTSVGTTLPKDVNGNFDCTIGVSEPIRLSISGTDAEVSWSVADADVLSVAADGKITPLKTGTTTVTAAVGGAAVNIIVRIR